MYGGKLDLCHMQNTANVSSIGEDITLNVIVLMSDKRPTGSKNTQRDQPLDERHLA